MLYTIDAIIPYKKPKTANKVLSPKPKAPTGPTGGETGAAGMEYGTTGGTGAAEGAEGPTGAGTGDLFDLKEPTAEKKKRR